MNKSVFLSLLSGVIVWFSNSSCKSSMKVAEKDTFKKSGVASIFKTTVFNAGEDGIDSYRIPSLVSSKKGALLLFAEAHKTSSTDKTPTDIAAGKGKRVTARSIDGGTTWRDRQIDLGLQSSVDYGGCQAGIFGMDTVLFYTDPAGGLGSDSTEDRQHFKIYRSLNGSKTWEKNFLLFDKAAGYSCITQLTDGRLAIVFETADSNGFRKMTPGNRPPGWMRLDVLILPKKIRHKNYWF